MNHIFTVHSKKNGNYSILLDDMGFSKMINMGNTLKWCARKCKNRHGLVYFQKRLQDQKLVELHRLITGAKKGEYVDHINGDTLDNRLCNLRICSNADNIRNGRVRTNNKSGFSGVFYDKNDGKWLAKIKVMYKTINLGRYINKEDAIQARKKAEVIYFNTA